MALAPLVLDDFTWDDLVAASRRRIPAASGGKWTLHAPVDPGVTLVELYAWLLEQRLFWLDQVPDGLVRALLELLGVAVQPARPAATVLAFDRAAPWVGVGAGVVRAERRGVPITFTSDGGVTLAPVDRVGLLAAGRDRSEDLAAGRAVRILPADGSAAEAQILLWMPSGPPGPLPDPLALLVELRGPAAIAEGWLPLAPADVPPPASLSWWYRNTAGAIVRWPEPIDDGTGGLRRSGVVRLPVPADWDFEPGSTVGGLSAYAVRLRTEQATFTAPPRVARVTPNVMVARHRRRVVHSQSAQWLPLPGNVAELPREDTPPIAESVELVLLETGSLQSWKPAPDLAFTGPGDRVFVVDREAGRLRFGDGLNGRIARLAPGLNLVVTYDVGGGGTGNLGTGLAWVDQATQRTLHNVVPAAGGAEPESLVAARQRAGEELRRVTRAITQSDYETLAVTTPGVALRRAHAAVGYHALHPCTPVPGMVTVFVVPDAPREERSDFYEDAYVATPRPDPGALAAARARLETARLVTHEVCVRSPIYRAASLRVEVHADPTDGGALRRRVAQGLQRFLDPLLGGADGGGWPFGEPLRPSALLREAQRTLGSEGTVAEVAIGLDGASTAESCHDVEIGPHALPGPVDIVVRITARAGVPGGLR
jgi:predicted phage baseplate assembly protein